MGCGVSATYHFVWMHQGFTPLPGLHINRDLSTPYCGICIPLYAVSLVVLFSNPVGLPFRVICLRYSSQTPWWASHYHLLWCWLLLRQRHWSCYHNQLEGAKWYMLLFSWSFDVFNHDFIWITNHVRVWPNKVYINFIILVIEFFHLNDVSMSLLPMVLFAFLGVLCFTILFVGRGTSSALWLPVSNVTMLVVLRVLFWTVGTSRCMVFCVISTLVVWGSFLLVLLLLITGVNCIDRFASSNTHVLCSMLNSTKALSLWWAAHWL